MRKLHDFPFQILKVVKDPNDSYQTNFVRIDRKNAFNFKSTVIFHGLLSNVSVKLSDIPKIWAVQN